MFKGENPTDWLFNTECYFILNNISPDLQLPLATLHLGVEALPWFMGKRSQFKKWEDFRIAFQLHFQKPLAVSIDPENSPPEDIHEDEVPATVADTVCYSTYQTAVEVPTLPMDDSRHNSTSEVPLVADNWEGLPSHHLGLSSSAQSKTVVIPHQVISETDPKAYIYFETPPTKRPLGISTHCTQVISTPPLIRSDCIPNSFTPDAVFSKKDYVSTHPPQLFDKMHERKLFDNMHESEDKEKQVGSTYALDSLLFKFLANTGLFIISFDPGICTHTPKLAYGALTKCVAGDFILSHHVFDNSSERIYKEQQVNIEQFLMHSIMPRTPNLDSLVLASLIGTSLPALLGFIITSFDPGICNAIFSLSYGDFSKCVYGDSRLSYLGLILLLTVAKYATHKELKCNATIALSWYNCMHQQFHTREKFKEEFRLQFVASRSATLEVKSTDILSVNSVGAQFETSTVVETPFRSQEIAIPEIGLHSETTMVVGSESRDIQNCVAAHFDMLLEKCFNLSLLEWKMMRPVILFSEIKLSQLYGKVISLFDPGILAATSILSYGNFSMQCIGDSCLSFLGYVIVACEDHYHSTLSSSALSLQASHQRSCFVTAARALLVMPYFCHSSDGTSPRIQTIKDSVSMGNCNKIQEAVMCPFTSQNSKLDTAAKSYATIAHVLQQYESQQFGLGHLYLWIMDYYSDGLGPSSLQLFLQQSLLAWHWVNTYMVSLGQCHPTGNSFLWHSIVDDKFIRAPLAIGRGIGTCFSEMELDNTYLVCSMPEFTSQTLYSFHGLWHSTTLLEWILIIAWIVYFSSLRTRMFSRGW